MSKVEEIIDQLKSLTLLEAADLVKQIEETFNVSAAAPVGGGMVMVAAAAGDSAEKPEEKTEFDLILEDVPAQGNKPIIFLFIIIFYCNYIIIIKLYYCNIKILHFFRFKYFND